MQTIRNIELWAIILIGLLSLCFLTDIAASSKDESAAYCIALGYNYTIDRTDRGDIGYCVPPSGARLDSWKFLQGKEGSEFGYCARKGYEQKIVRNLSICVPYLTDCCAVCVLPNGTEMEVTKLMNLSFYNTICGDGLCRPSENSRSCPEDCPSGGWDYYCDSIADDKCDPDCIDGGDPDCR